VVGDTEGEFMYPGDRPDNPVAVEESAHTVGREGS
jgi:hypothetical protein